MEILDRIRKLFELSQRNNSTAEAAAAAAKIQDLCFKYNVELAQALAADPTTKQEAYTKYDYILPNTNRADCGWKRTLFNGVCLANFCKAVYIPGTVRMAVIGQRHNFEVVTYEFEYLVKEIQRLALENCVKQAFLSSKLKRQYLAGFCEGAMSAVCDTLRASHTYQAQQTSDGRALVVVKDKQLEIATKEFFPRLTKGHRRVGGSQDGRGDGRRIGQGITVNRGIGSQSRTLIN
jgi:hypothetical protein